MRWKRKKRIKKIESKVTLLSYKRQARSWMKIIIIELLKCYLVMKIVRTKKRIDHFKLELTLKY